MPFAWLKENVDSSVHSQLALLLSNGPKHGFPQSHRWPALTLLQPQLGLGMITSCTYTPSCVPMLVFMHEQLYCARAKKVYPAWSIHTIQTNWTSQMPSVSAP